MKKSKISNILKKKYFFIEKFSKHNYVRICKKNNFMKFLDVKKMINKQKLKKNNNFFNKLNGHEYIKNLVQK